MTAKSNQIKKSIRAINEHGILLVFPVKGKAEPRSLWSVLHPKSKMIWSWNEDADGKVARLWSTMKELSTDKSVVYSKWFKGRATFLSRKVFRALLKIRSQETASISPAARLILELLENDSPLSTKQLKRFSELQGKDNQKIYDRALRELFQNFLIVGYGEVEDGAFPSLAVGATRTLFEDLWNESHQLSIEEAEEILNTFFPMESEFIKFFNKTLK